MRAPCTVSSRGRWRSELDDLLRRALHAACRARWDARARITPVRSRAPAHCGKISMVMW
jgi:hypothetical protein